jgi:hypothetical protein
MKIATNLILLSLILCATLTHLKLRHCDRLLHENLRSLQSEQISEMAPVAIVVAPPVTGVMVYYTGRSAPSLINVTAVYAVAKKEK